MFNFYIDKNTFPNGHKKTDVNAFYRPISVLPV